jgi:DNA-binding transcriptional LysR family regulator
MDRFDAMRVFTRIVERRSFTQAADDLGLPRSSVTDAVKGLEARLGVRLLQRTTRQVSPTLDGEAYYQRCVSLIAEMEDAEGANAPAEFVAHLRAGAGIAEGEIKSLHPISQTVEIGICD